MKKLIVSILAVLTLCMAAVPAFAEEAPPVPEPAATGPILWYHVTTPLNEPDVSYCAKIREVGEQMGYTSYISNLPTASALYNDLPTSTIGIIHGHGDPGISYLDQKNGAAQQLLTTYSVSGYTYKNITSYSSNALANNNLIMYFTCKSARPYSTDDSMVEIAYERGANCVTGFYDPVWKAEHWGKFVFEYSHNRVNLGRAIEQANAAYTNIYGSTSETSVTHEGNLRIYGDVLQKLRLN